MILKVLSNQNDSMIIYTTSGETPRPLLSGTGGRAGACLWKEIRAQLRCCWTAQAEAATSASLQHSLSWPSVWLLRCHQPWAREFLTPHGKTQVAKLLRQGCPLWDAARAPGSSAAPKQQQRFTSPKNASSVSLLSRSHWENHQKYRLCCTLQLKRN